MMHGKFNPDIFCNVIKQIFAERNENVEVKVRLISKVKEITLNQKDKTA